jgi:hypothetical protein
MAAPRHRTFEANCPKLFSFISMKKVPRFYVQDFSIRLFSQTLLQFLQNEQVKQKIQHRSLWIAEEKMQR